MSRPDDFSFSDLSSAKRELLQELRQNSARAVMFHQLVSEKLGLNATDHKCLDFLNRVGPVTAGKLSELTGLTTGAVTSVIDRLEQAGYVVRDKDPNDRRRVVVKPVPKGSDDIAPMFRSVTEATLDILERYDERETLLLLDFIRRCNDMTLAEMNKLNRSDD
ncbi:MarR family winged helix-turn-helix transcriptional regulator [Paenibacillus flagellatus]|uniref:MarR family transcriptional regulator n=1 Tax=Paenibacillus flagellatus TaxID=2211139 RepID=A0A2V5K751_9BACL|nr:MarR family transcriptional regulator [Paenibacillus flagellatus]PYI53744.1 MarR family transcriptional regulator [Paenibacillus flagellatus]